MQFVLFCHSLASDWNHGNAHFLRGVVSELIDRGHAVRVFEPVDSWSRQNLVKEHGPAAAQRYRDVYPRLRSHRYQLHSLDLDRALDGADVVLVHEWNESELVERIGRHRGRRRDYRLLFHDTHHRSATAPQQMKQYNLEHYDGVLAFGQMIRDLYLQQGWAQRAWTWHEAADTRVFRPRRSDRPAGDVVWIGNWGDEERTDELQEFLLEPIRRLRLRAEIYGVRYPEAGTQAVAAAGARYRGWLPNYRAPKVFGQFHATVHVPRRPYREQLVGIPTIRVFEALACGIPLVTAPWDDAEGLFRPEEDYLIARDGADMQRKLREILHEPERARALSRNGIQRIAARHTCGHRVEELLRIVESLKAVAPPKQASDVTPAVAETTARRSA